MKNKNIDIADSLGRKQFPELAELMNIRNILMEAAEKISGYEHEGSGAGLGGADFSFYLNGKYYQVNVSELA